MAETIRVFWRNAQSGWRNFNWDGVIGANAVVHISACECFFPEDNLFGAEGVVRTRGDATIDVKNIRPHGPNPGQTLTGGVEFYLQVDWGTPLNVATDITVLEDPVGKVIA